MRILDHDDLPPGIEDQVQLLDGAAGWGPMDFSRVKRARKTGYPAADYFGVYAVEDGKVSSMVRVLRLPFTTRRGLEKVAAIQGVVTRRDRSRKGLARKLLEEVHRRERDAGNRFVLLWTGRGQVAHALYNSMGYADIYTPELAIRKCGLPTKSRKGYELRKASAADLDVIERLHGKATQGHLGFTPRPKGIVRSLLGLGFLTTEPFRIVLRKGEPVGYGLIQKNPSWSRLDEVVVMEGEDTGEVLSLFESETKGKWLELRNTFVRDALGVLRKRGYAITRFAYYGLLGLGLADQGQDVANELGVSSQKFACQQLDYF